MKNKTDRNGSTTRGSAERKAENGVGTIKGGTARGAGASLPAGNEPAMGEPVLMSVAWGSVKRSGTNPRKSFTGMKELEESIRLHGIQQPLLVRPIAQWTLLEPDLVCKEWRIQCADTGETVDFSNLPMGKALAVTALEDRNRWAYELVAGERRHRAAAAAGLEKVPVICRTMSDLQAREVQQLENLQREDLNALEEAAGYKDLMEQHGWNADKLAARLNKSRSHIFEKLALLKVSAAVRKAIEDGQVTASVASLIGRLPGEKLQGEALKKIVSEGTDWQSGYNPLSYRAAAKVIREEFLVDLGKAAFDQGVVYAGKGAQPYACKDCPMRSGNARDEFPDIESPNVCTDPACYRRKAQLHGEQEKTRLEAKGATVLPLEKARELFQCGGHLRYDSGYTKLEETCYEAGGKSYKTLFKGHVKPVVAINEEGEAVELVKTAELPDLFQAAGIRKGGSNGGGRSDADKKSEAARKARIETAKAAVPLILEAAVVDAGGRVEAGFLNLLARAAYDHTSIDVHAFVAKRRGLAKVQGEARPALEKLLKEIAGDREECMKLTMELLVAGNHGISSWSNGYGDLFKQACALAKVDLKALEKTLSTPRQGRKAGGKGQAELSIEGLAALKKGIGVGRLGEASLPATKAAKGKTVVHRWKRAKGTVTQGK